MDRDHLRTATLAQVARWYERGYLGKADARWYLEQWNTTSFRFTVAYLDGGHIRQRERTDADDLNPDLAYRGPNAAEKKPVYTRASAHTCHYPGSTGECKGCRS